MFRPSAKTLLGVFVSFLVILLLIAVVRAVFPGVLSGFEDDEDSFIAGRTASTRSRRR